MVEVVMFYAGPERDNVAPDKNGSSVAHVHIRGLAHSQPHPYVDEKKMQNIQMQCHTETRAEDLQ